MKVLGWFLSYIIVMLSILAATHAQQDSFTVTIHHDRNWDPSLSYFRFASPDGTQLIVIGDDDLPLVRWLTRHDGKKVRLTLLQQEGLTR